MLLNIGDSQYGANQRISGKLNTLNNFQQKIAERVKQYDESRKGSANGSTLLLDFTKNFNPELTGDAQKKAIEDFKKSPLYKNVIQDYAAASGLTEGSAEEMFEENDDKLFAVMRELARQQNDSLNGVEDPQKEQEVEQKRQEALRNANSTKLVDVAVISSLDEFVKNFFNSSEPGSFKYFSEQFIISLEQLVKKLNIVDNVSAQLVKISDFCTNFDKQLGTIFDVVKKIPEHTRDVIDKVRSNATFITRSLKKEGLSVKTHIDEKFSDSGIDKMDTYFDTLIKYEKQQTECLNEQLNVLKQTTVLLAASGGNKNVTIIQNQQPSSENSVNTFDMPEPGNQHTATAMRFVGDLSM